MEMFITFKDGKHDWVDPVKSHYVKDNVLYVDNGHYTYDYDLSLVENYKLQPKGDE